MIHPWKRTLFALPLAVAVAMAAPTDARAQTTPTLPVVQIPATVNGVAQTLTFTVQQFEHVGNQLLAVGSLTGPGIANALAVAVPVQPTQGSCNVLTLNLGPLHLDLLGLVIDLSQVNLTITAQQGPGNLLGNLLCDVAHLLDTGGGGGVGALTNLLNQILGLLGGL